VNQPGAKVLFGMGDADMSAGFRMDIDMVGALDPVKLPPGRNKYPEQFSAICGVYYTHNKCLK